MKLKTRLCIFVYLVSFSSILNGQTGGDNIYESLNLVSSARAAALGGSTISIKDNDLDLAWINPALLSPEMNNNLILNFVDYFSDINFGSFYYSKDFSSLGSFATGIQYIHYGTFKEADATGAIIRDFDATDMTFNIGWGKKITPKIKTQNKGIIKLDSLFYVGSNLKLMYSNYHFDYTSLGLAMDFAGIFHQPKTNLAIALLIKNVGIQLVSYTDQNKEPMPFEVQLGFSKRLNHAPFRVMLNFSHLEKWDLTYTDPTYTNTSLNNPISSDTLLIDKIGTNLKGFSDKLMRHVNLGAEVIITDNFNIRFGYNYRRRKEMLVSTKKGMAGFSVGVGIKISKFHFSYGRATYHIAGSPNHITIRTNISDFIKRNE